jgi:hypothetical protein
MDLGVTVCDFFRWAPGIDRCTLLRGMTSRAAALVVSLLLTIPGLVTAAPVSMFNTGVDIAGNVLPANTLGDPHFTLIIAPLGVDTQLKIWSAASGFPVAPSGPWLGDDTLSRWIGLDTMYSDGLPHSPIQSGTYIFRTTFNLTAQDFVSATIAGRWAADDLGAILLNGTTLGATSGAGPGFFSLTDFSIDSGFVAGVNTLDFIVTNTFSPDVTVYNPVGLRVEFSAASARALPEPPMSLLVLVVSAAALVRRRKRV